MHIELVRRRRVYIEGTGDGGVQNLSKPGTSASSRPVIDQTPDPTTLTRASDLRFLHEVLAKYIYRKTCISNY